MILSTMVTDAAIPQYWDTRLRQVSQRIINHDKPALQVASQLGNLPRKRGGLPVSISMPLANLKSESTSHNALGSAMSVKRYAQWNHPAMTP